MLAVLAGICASAGVLAALAVIGICASAGGAGGDIWVYLEIINTERDFTKMRDS